MSSAEVKVEVLRSQVSARRIVDNPFQAELVCTVEKLLQRGKGLLAADESEGTCAKRLVDIGLENNYEHRRMYRELMLNTDGLEQYVSGVILHDETFRQKTKDGIMFPELLAKKGMVVGIKTDLGLVDLHSGAPGEQATQGLDNYLKRAQSYYKAGARFCKWRNVYRIQCGTVSEALLSHNAQTLARFAIISQFAGLVPIVEPEVLIDGSHTLDQCREVSERAWSLVSQKLHEYGIIWEGMLLKPNMVVPGAESGIKVSPEQVALATLTALGRSIPAAVPGITFLSGGLSEIQASEYLNAMNNCQSLSKPWALRFSYARALQASALKAWGGKEEGIPKARSILLHRAKMNFLASQGKYIRAEDDSDTQSLYVKNYKY